MESINFSNINLDFYKNNDNYKISDDRISSNPNYSIYDIRLKPSREYMVFNKEFQYYNKITRRGLTFLQDNNNQSKQIVIRKGLPKFFDLSNQDFMKKKNPKLSLYGKNINLSINKFNKEQFQMFMTKKLNGMNMQISYCEQLNKFLICTKNTSLMVKNLEEASQDIDYFNTFNFQIAQQFFKIYNSQNQQQQSVIKNILKDHTFIGEYVGGVTNQHITNELEPYIQFYAAVLKQTFEDDVIPVEKSKELIVQAGLKFVDFIKFSGSKKAMFETLKLQLKNCADGDLNTIGEGYVIYFEYSDKNILIAKMKGLVYRQERRYREFAKLVKIKGISQIKKIKQKEIQVFKNMMKEYKLNKEEASIKVQQADQIIEEIIKDYQKGILNTDDWIGYRFKLNQIPNEKPIYIIIPLGIPGSGKSYFYENIIQKICQEQNFQLQTISSDHIRQQLMKREAQKDLNISNQQQFENTQHISRNIFNESLIRKLIEVKYQIRNIKQRGTVVYIDKNFNKRTLNRIIDIIKIQLHQQNYKIFLSVPKMNEKEVERLNYSDIVRCLIQIKNRSNHKTLQYESIKTFNILKDFTQTYDSFFKKSFDVDEIIQYAKFDKIDNIEQIKKELENVNSDKQLDQILDKINIQYDDKFNLELISKIEQIFINNTQYKEKKISFKYLGIDLSSNKKQFINLFKQSLINSNQKQLINEILKGKEWNVIRDLHITLLHQNDMLQKNYDDKLKSFKENQKIKIEIQSMIITEDFNVNFFIKIPNDLIIMNNKLHHITLAIKNSNPYYSNFILSQMKKKNKLNSDKNEIDQFHFKNKVYNCWIFNYIEKPILECYTKKYMYQLNQSVFIFYLQCNYL